VDPKGLVVLVDEALFSTTGRSLGFSLSATLSHLIVKAEIVTSVVDPGKIYSGSVRNDLTNNSGQDSVLGIRIRMFLGHPDLDPLIKRNGSGS
jgi:hypothetical protein